MLAACLAFGVAPALRSQNRTSAISGTVRDQSGAVLAGARITIRNEKTALERKVTTDGEGRYRASGLEVGTYEVAAERDMFSPSRLAGIVLALDREAVADLTLSVAGVSSGVVVTAEARIVDAAASALSGLVWGERIRDLPLNGRDYTHLAVLEPGIHVARGRERNVNTGYGIQLSIAGSRPVQNNFRLDGISLTDQTGSTPGSVNGLSLGVDAISEFTTLVSAYNAQYGRAAGGIVNAVTRAGTNDPHGTLSYYHRNDNLDARNFFDRSQPPEFRRNQFGASAGGPLRRNRTFFFANYEGLRESRGNTTIDTTLSDEARQGRLRSGTVTVDPAIAKLLELYPRPNADVLGDAALFVYVNELAAREDFVTARADHSIGARDQLFIRYTLDDARRQDATAFALNTRLGDGRRQSAATEEMHVFSPELLASTRLGFARSLTQSNVTEARVAGTDDPELAFVPGHRAIGLVEVQGLTLFPGGSGALDSDAQALDSVQLYEDVARTRGGHSLKFGAALERTRFNTDSRSIAHGDYRFRSLGEFLTNRPDRFRAQLPGSDTVRGFRQWVVAWYAHGSWKVRRTLTLEAGLRHEWNSVPREVNGKISNLDELSSPVTRVGDPLFDNPSLANLAPRAGIAWDVTGRGGTVLRAGYGVYHDLVLSHNLLISGVRNTPFFLRGDTRNLASGDFPAGGYARLVSKPNVDLAVERIPRDLEQPYVQQWNLNIERRLGSRSAATIAYSGSHGVHLTAIVEDANLAVPVRQADGRQYFPPDGQKQNPNFSMIRDRRFDGHSFYHGLLVSADHAMGDTLRLRGSYTFARSIDDNSTTFAQTEAANAIGIPVNGDPKFNRGPSNHDIGHHFGTSGLWDLPGPKNGAAGALFGGWRMGTILTLASGPPFSLTLSYDAARTRTARPDRRGGQRPDLRPGASNNPVTGDPNRWFDPNSFARPADGYLGNLGRNTLRGPGLANVDLMLEKAIPVRRLGENGRIIFRLEAFNAPNHTNFDLPAPERMQVFTRTSMPEDTGRITSAGPSREIQIAVRLMF